MLSLRNQLLSLCLVISPSLGFAVEKRVVEVKQPVLDSLVVTINGETRRIQANSDVIVVSGDELVVKQAMLSPADSKPYSVNVLGFQINDANGVALDDRNQTVHTDRDLITRFSEDKQGEVYRIKIGRAGKELGEMRLVLVKPELRYAALEVNGQVRVLRVGEIARFSGADKFKVKEVVTNVSNDDSEVKYEIVPKSETIDLPTKVQFYELRFLRKGKVFAQIPLQIEDK